MGETSGLQVVVYVLIAAAGTAVVLSRELVKVAMMLSFLGLVLAVAFLTFQAPDVSLSEIAVGSLALPLLILLAVSKTRSRQG
ncbi:MAG TPA: DUF4040 domain-containing protein [Candidatus Dormibacteraeota bacterium]|jgi:uncharacterized MnhB-related membrane protein|nr:DUF4040 domain-containing protein [Candidatus Dormibacteraeota bacterium]